MRRPRLVLALLASCATLPAAAPSDATSLKAHRFLFMGGLQRSGTTWLEGLVASPLTSALSFENIDPREYERLQPWRLQARPPTRAPAPRGAASLTTMRTHAHRTTRASTLRWWCPGGVEGKFVQDVYPYLYLVRDTGLAAAAGADRDPDGEAPAAG